MISNRPSKNIIENFSKLEPIKSVWDVQCTMAYNYTCNVVTSTGVSTFNRTDLPVDLTVKDHHTLTPYSVFLYSPRFHHTCTHVSFCLVTMETWERCTAKLVESHHQLTHQWPDLPRPGWLRAADFLSGRHSGTATPWKNIVCEPQRTDKWCLEKWLVVCSHVLYNIPYPLTNL